MTNLCPKNLLEEISQRGGPILKEPHQTKDFFFFGFCSLLEVCTQRKHYCFDSFGLFCSFRRGGRGGVG